MVANFLWLPFGVTLHYLLHNSVLCTVETPRRTECGTLVAPSDSYLVAPSSISWRPNRSIVILSAFISFPKQDPATSVLQGYNHQQHASPVSPRDEIICFLIILICAVGRSYECIVTVQRRERRTQRCLRLNTHITNLSGNAKPWLMRPKIRSEFINSP